MLLPVHDGTDPAEMPYGLVQGGVRLRHFGEGFGLSSRIQVLGNGLVNVIVGVVGLQNMRPMGTIAAQQANGTGLVAGNEIHSHGKILRELHVLSNENPKGKQTIHRFEHRLVPQAARLLPHALPGGIQRKLPAGDKRVKLCLRPMLHALPSMMRTTSRVWSLSRAIPRGCVGS